MKILLFLPIGDQLMNQSYERVCYLAFPFFSYYNSLQHILLEVRCDVPIDCWDLDEVAWSVSVIISLSIVAIIIPS
jgi:hypothetical protein